MLGLPQRKHGRAFRLAQRPHDTVGRSLSFRVLFLASPYLGMEFFSGRFIVFCGPNGAGKSTLLRLFADTLRAAGDKVLETREPGGSPFGEAIRPHLKNPDLPRDKFSEALLFASLRGMHLHQVVEPAVAAGKTVLCDRYVPSTLVYQVLLGGLPESAQEMIRAVNSQFRVPDITVFVLPGAADLAKRRSNRSGDRDAMQADVEEELQAYRQVANSYPGAVVLELSSTDMPFDTLESLALALAPMLAGLAPVDVAA